MTSVQLIAISKPVIEGVSSSEELLAYCARVSSSANQMKHDTGPKLIKSLITRKEWSPLEMVSLTMEINTTRDIARQILRHRSFSFQEFSQRYSKVEGDAAIFRAYRSKHPTDRQRSIDPTEAGDNEWWRMEQELLWEHAYASYENALAGGIAKEVARAVLPEGLTPSRLYMAGTLRSWWHYTELRSEEATQKEHREIAEAAREIILKEFPSLVEVAASPPTV